MSTGETKYTLYGGSIPSRGTTSVHLSDSRYTEMDAQRTVYEVKRKLILTV